MNTRNKSRKDTNTTVTISMSKELKAQAKTLAVARGMENLSALIRVLFIEELKREEREKTGGDDETHPVIAPRHLMERGAGGVSGLHLKR